MKQRYPRFLLSAFFVFLSILLSAADAPPITRSVCILSGENGSGSGFFASIEGRNVVVTNNHVLLEIKNAKLLDVNGNEYEYDEIFASPFPDCDLAVIPVERDNLDEMPNLKIHPEVDTLPPGTKAVAYGNSLGASVVVAESGKYLGVGPAKIEVDVPFVPGNSGGPVVEMKTGCVIGVATYMTIIYAKRASSAGSRFQPKDYEPTVRRFATRIDRIDLKKFQRTNRKRVEEDQEVFLPVKALYEQIDKAVRASSGEVAYEIRKLKSMYRDWTPPSKGRRWNTKYLEGRWKEMSDLVEIARDILMTERETQEMRTHEYVKRKELSELWNEFRKTVEFKTKKPVFLPCPLCNGRGRIWLKRNVGAGKLMADKVSKPCPLCLGRNKVRIGAPDRYALLPKEFVSKSADMFVPEPALVFGVSLGKAYSSPAAIDSFYRTKKRGKTNFGVFTVYSFPGNPVAPEAEETRLWFFGDVLLRLDVVFTERLDSLSSETKALVREAGGPSSCIDSIKLFRKLKCMEKPDSSGVQDNSENSYHYLLDRWGRRRRLYESFAEDPFHRLAPVADAGDCIAVIVKHVGWDFCKELTDARRRAR